MGNSNTLDKRLNAFRPDLADKQLQGRVNAEAYVTGTPAGIISHFADVLDRPDEGAGLQTQFLHGHEVMVFDRKDGWAWVQSQTDGYVGYVRQESLVGDSASMRQTPTHMVKAPRTFLYSQSDLKSPRCGYRSMGSKLCAVNQTTTRGTDYTILDSGESVISNHLIELDAWMNDPVDVALTLLHTPYLWGGSTGFGIDCSGLVSLSHLLCGNMVLRDSDMQAASIGKKLPFDLDQLQRGDLVFWKGHVGMMTGPDDMIHANGHTMNVAIEPLAQAVERIGYLYGQPTLLRRP